jgi:hypothetical protein
MKKVFWILILQAGILAPAFGQFITPEKIDVNTVKSKILLVETQEEVTRTLMDLRSRPEAQQAYKDGVANFNQWMKDAVEKYYKWGTKGIEYMPALQVQKMVQEGKASKYAILHYTIQNSAVNPMDIGPVYGGKYNDSVRAFSKSKGYGILSIQLPTNDKKTRDVFNISLPVAYPSAGDMVYAMEMIHNVFTKVMKVKDFQVKEFRDDIAVYNRILENKEITLLIDKNQLSDKTDINDLRKGYSGPIEVVEYEKVNEAILQNDSNYAYVVIVPEKSTPTTSAARLVIYHLVIDAKDGRVLGSDKPGRMNYNAIATDITRKEVKEYIEDPKKLEEYRKKEGLDKKEGPKKKEAPKKK